MKEEIFKRKSIRKYSEEKISDELMKEIEEKLIKLTPLHQEIKFKGHLVLQGERLRGCFKGIIGKCVKVISPYYVVITSEEKEGYLENVGYALEEFVLWLTGKGIGTCWVGAKINRELLEKIITIDEGQVPVILIAFGYAADINNFNLEMDPGFRRKHLEEIVQGKLDETWERIFQGVRRAPSAVNLQPWRFVVKKNKIQCYLKESFLTNKLVNYKRIDGGISLYHLHEMCRCNDIAISFSLEAEEPLDKYEYLITVTY